ncbi:MAG: hypothetical protein ABI624_19465, partial [Casimicrobiaceae bacterium]
MGLGDTIYLRAVLREVVDSHRVYVQTVWPQLFEGLPIRCVRRATKLRTQEKNAGRVELVWYAAPAGVRPQSVHYVGKPGTMLQGLYD